MKKVNILFGILLSASAFTLSNNLYAHGCSTAAPSNAQGEKNETEPNNDFAHANTLQPNVFYNGTADKGMRDDYFIFHSQAKQVQITLDIENAYDDFIVKIYNKVRNKISHERILGGDIKQKTISVPAGRKFISLHSANHKGANTPYKLKVRF